ncbi:hypothetical protein [Thermocrinis sp.]
MIRIMLLSLALIFGSYMASFWIMDHQSIPPKKEEIGILEGINIKVFGKNGVEWYVEGSRAKIENSAVFIEQAKFQSDGATLVADKALIDRISGEGLLEGNVVLYTKEGIMSTPRAEVKLREGIAYGKEGIILKDTAHGIEGKEWYLQVKPLRVIIKKAKVRSQ